MALRDGTGPQGNGPRTGRGLGPCEPENTVSPSPEDSYGENYGEGQQGRRPFQDDE